MRDLRVVAVLAGLLGQLAAATAGVLPWPLVPVSAVLYAAGAVVSGRAGPSRAARLQVLATSAALVLAVLTIPHISVDRDGLRESLGLLLVGIQVVHALTWQRRRDLQTALLIAAGLLVLG